jgi:hypothetical protein
MTFGSTPVAQLATPIAQQLTVMETELPVPTVVFGLITFGVLLAMLLVVTSIGNGRPHS